MATGHRAFISHITEEASLATALQDSLRHDFLGLLDIYVSSDIESIAAGEIWLTSIENSLRQSDLLLILCSPDSIRRPWINFEAGAAWAFGIPIVPICHSGLTPRDLLMPLSLRQGIVIGEPDGLRRLYTRMSQLLACNIPSSNFEKMAETLSAIPMQITANSRERRMLEDDRGIWRRLHEALNHPEHAWRTLEWAAAEAGVSEEVAADTLRANEEVRFSKGKGGRMIVGLRARVGP